MNILFDPLPDAISVSGRDTLIDTDARTWMRFELMLFEKGVPDEWKGAAALEMCLAEPVQSVAEALDGILWFYRCGQAEKLQPKAEGRKRPRIYDFDQDATLIYAAILKQYGIDLQRQQLHWWQFRALFDGLTDDNLFVKVMGYRAMDTHKIKDKEQRRHYRKLQAQYALRESLDEQEKAAKAGAIFGGGL